MDESKSPCIGCDFEHEDKNKERCANCEKRIKYASDQGLISIEALEADKAAREETRKILEMEAGIIKMPKKKTGPKPKPRKEEKIVLGQPRKLTGRYNDRFNLRIAPKKTDLRVVKALEDLWKIAAIEFRKPSSQGAIFIIQGIEKWKKEHGTS